MKTKVLSGLIFVVLTLFFTQIRVTAQEQTQARANLADDIMKELACYCGCRLPASNCEGNMTCGESQKLKEEVTQLLSQGNTKKEVLAALVKKYGESILAAPPKKGFDLVAWVLPFFALLVGGFVVSIVIRKLSAKPAPVAQTKTTSKKQATSKTAVSDLERRFEQELKEFDEQ